MEIIYLQTESEFETLKNTTQFLVVDFYSEDCPPCEKLAPLYEKMARAFPSVTFIKVFRQGFRPLAESFGVSGSPTVLFFHSGSIMEQRLSGDISENEFSAILVSLCGVDGIEATGDMVKKELVDLCIIGNGPAGMSAAIYAARYKVNQILVGDLPGGLMTSSHKICNYPSETEISGMDLTTKMADHVTALEVPQKIARVDAIQQVDDRFDVTLSTGEVIAAKTILLATGTKHRHLGVPNEKELTGRGVSYCATCDALFYKNKTVAVIGGSDSANTAALYLAEVAAKVYQIYRGEALRGETAWIDQILANEKISVLFNTEVTEIIGTDRVTGVRLTQPVNGQHELPLDGVFVEVGSDPDLTLMQQLGLETDSSNYIVTQANQMTSRPGVWAAGDITTNSNGFRQIVTACSEGSIAAESIFKHLQLQKKK